MSPKRTESWARRVVCGVLLAAMLPTGCNPFATYSANWGSDPVKPAEYPLVFNDGPKKGKEAVVSVVVTYSRDIDFAFAGSEQKLTSELVQKLSDIAKESKQKLLVVEPSIENSSDAKTNWRLLYKNTWGNKRFVDFVLTVHLDKLSIYKPGTLNRVYDGQAEIIVDVEEVDAGSTKPKYHYIHPFKYPKNAVLDATAIPVTQFKKAFLEHLADEISRLHVEQRVSSGIVGDE